MTLYGYARVSVREPQDKNLDLQVERLVRAGCAMGHIRAEEASGAKNDRGGRLELLDLVLEGDTLTLTNRAWTMSIAALFVSVMTLLLAGITPYMYQS